MRAWKPRTVVVVVCATIAMLAASSHLLRAQDAKKTSTPDTSANAPAANPAESASGDLVQQMLAPYIGGEWKIKAAWAGGNPLEGREVFDWGIGKKFVTCKT